MAASAPDRLALEFEDDGLTYGELDTAADGVAHGLLDELGVGHHRVGLRLWDTKRIAVAALGVSRAGMVTVPLPPSDPAPRTAAMLADVGAELLLTDQLSIDVDGVTLRDPMTYVGGRAGPVELPSGPVRSIVFTSGSTGVPKGVMLPPSPPVDASTLGSLGFLQDVEHIRGALFCNGTAGALTGMLLGSFAMGGTIVAYEVRQLGSEGSAEWLQRQEVYSLTSVPTLARQVFASLPDGMVLPHLHLVILYSETSTWEDVVLLRQHLPADGLVYNLFASTEAGGISGLLIPNTQPPGVGPLPVGQPSVPGGSVVICDDEGRPLADGEVGEIVVRGGTGAGLGYWGRPDLNRQVFRSHEDGSRDVRTGDAGRLKDGVLEHFGRLDHVVKISGHRVELGEVETTLRQFDEVLDAAATTYTDGAGDNRLLAFVVAAPGEAVSAPVLRSELARRLPGSMVPDRIQVLDRLPQLPGGKVDRRELASLRSDERPGVRHQEPIGDLEKALSRIWSEILDLDRVGRDENFFDIGGDSIRAARVFAAMESRLDVDRPISLLLEAPTIATLASLIESKSSTWDPLLPVHPTGSRVPLFAIHGGDGDVLYARLLSEYLGPDQPLYGLRGATISGRATTERDISGLAASYAAAIRHVRPAGPYYLFGYSVGGLIAFDMARQLVASGEQVGLVVLGDSSAPGTMAAAVALSVAERLRRRGEEVRDLGWRRAPSHVARVLTQSVRVRLPGYVPPHERVNALIRMSLAKGARVPPFARETFGVKHYGSMAGRYRPTDTYHGRVVLVRSADSAARRDLGWSEYATDLSVLEMSGGHQEMVQRQYIRELADHLRKQLAEVASQ